MKSLVSLEIDYSGFYKHGEVFSSETHRCNRPHADHLQTEYGPIALLSRHSVSML